MSVRIYSVKKDGLAWKKGVRGGDLLISVNGEEINDVLDYDFYMTEKKVELKILSAESKAEKHIEIRKGEYEDIGLEFETYLMDKQKSCRNKCVFCFIDQLPKGMRESLYFKDDDSRLSFFYGNYITLTNLTDRDVDRIIKMHISPINVSVHTMNPELRVKMMANPRAGETLGYLEKFAKAGIKINAQLVLCPGINDGEELKYSVRELSRLYPELESIACVPVGITKYREGLCKLEGYDEKKSGEVIDIIEELAEENKKIYGDRIVYPADEFFIKSGRKMPEDEYYGDYNQLENGVGMCAMLKSEFTAALDSAEAKEISRNVTIATGVAAAPMIENFAKMAEEKFSGLKIKVYGIENKFFGETITVAGLLTGKDIFEALRGKPLGDEVLISKSMLRSDDIFLDDMSRAELEKRLGVKITATENDGFELLRAMTGEET